MSGKQAKAKRKSAKKQAAAQPTPVVAGARLEEFIIGNVRCFAGEQRVPIRPITLLVGENSTGKTTVLGCYQKFMDSFTAVSNPLMGVDAEGGFVKFPFSMGGFADIARRAGNGKRQAREFRVGGVVSGAGGAAFPFSLTYSYGDEHGEARASRMTLDFPGGQQFAVVKEGKWKISAGEDNHAALNITGPGFNSRALLHDVLVGELGLKTIVGVCMVPVMSEEQAKSLRIPPRFPVAPYEQRVKNQKKMLDFLMEKFGARKGEPAGALIVRLGMLYAALGECAAVTPVRPMPRRSYDAGVNGNGEERFIAGLSRLARVNKNEWEKLRARLVEFGVKSEMFSNLELESHGGDADSSFSLRVNARGVDANIADVGCGVSQLLPFLGRVARASMKRERKHFLFQQPEDHLHPRAQAEFASFIVDAATKDRHTFLVETHSDFIVDRVRICVADGLIAPEDVSLLYFEPQKTGGAVKIHRIELNRHGEPAAFLKGYRDFFLHETERVLGFRD